MFDRDGNGFISKQELGMAMRSLGYMPNEVELEVIIQRLDMDGETRTHTHRRKYSGHAHRHTHKHPHGYAYTHSCVLANPLA